MKAQSTLPEGYKEIFSVNLQTNKKIAMFVNVLATLIAVVLAVPAHFIVPIQTLFDMSDGLVVYAIRFMVLLILMILYIVLHEMVHGIVMKYYGTQKVKFGFTGLYAFAGSDDYYAKKSYFIIALAPVVLWGVVLGIVNCLVPKEWFWVVYMIQLCNLSGAAGDLYVTVKFSKMPKDILVQDCGIGMTVYSKESKEKTYE